MGGCEQAKALSPGEAKDSARLESPRKVSPHSGAGVLIFASPYDIILLYLIKVFRERITLILATC
jgi:hypothetical protein